MFVDIHNHIIPGIDDGSDSLRTSLEMFRIAKSENIGKIIATPHFIYGSINNTTEYIKHRGEQLAAAAAENGIELYFGCEAFICPELCSLVEENTTCRMNDSRYVLIEFPMMSIPTYATDVLFNLQLKGYTPIIAHPERYKAFRENDRELYKLIECGMLAQVNATSITGLYGKEVKKTAMKFIECGLVHFVASDAHTTRSRAPKLLKAYDAISKEFGRGMADRLFTKNGQAVLDNVAIIAEAPVKKKRNFFIAMFGF